MIKGLNKVSTNYGQNAIIIHMIETLLTQLGFTEKETNVYLAILRAGKVTPGSLAIATHLKRTTVYHIIEELLKRGVIAEDITKKTRTLVALPPEELERVITIEEEALQKKRKVVSQAVDALREVNQGGGIAMPKIQYIGEEDIERYLYKQTPVWNESIRRTDGYWWGYSDPSFVEIYQDWIRWYWKQKDSSDIKDNLLTSAAPIEAQLAGEGLERRKVKLWPGGQGFTGSQWVAGEYLILVMTSKHPYYLLEIRDAVQAQNMRMLMKGIWAAIK